MRTSFQLSLALLFTLMVLVSDSGFAADPGPADADAPKAFKTTASGLKYRVLRKSGGKKPKASDTVTVHYRGWLDDKTVFDSSYKRDKPASFPVKGVIKGWTEALQLMHVGDNWQLFVPSERLTALPSAVN